MKMKIQDIEIYIVEADRYLQFNDISGDDLYKVWTQIKTNYAGYEKWVCYHDYKNIPYDLLAELGAVLEDDCTAMRLYPHNAKYTDTGAEQISSETFAEFAAIHDAKNTGIHWTGERLKRELPRWGIFCLREGGIITDYIIMSMRHPEEAEIFIVVASDIYKRKALISSAAKYAFDNGRTNVLYMVDEDTQEQSASDVGFIVTGFYKGYKFPSI
ncbi:MAG: hypothetical protein FWC95_01400 [Defluviitaleaceae bacterium]|nr:hypothetical protein [Defluviitaleaceae bacterium]